MHNDDKNPRWWNDRHTGAWERVKEAFARDWEQTKADFSKTKGRDLNQNAVDTIKQATGSTMPPPPSVPNVKDDDYETAEPALRYGHGAASHYAESKDWDPALEDTMRREWDELHSERDWDSVRGYVRRGWDRARHPRS
jgi:hypothetical protein